MSVTDGIGQPTCSLSCLYYFFWLRVLD